MNTFFSITSVVSARPCFAKRWLAVLMTVSLWASSTLSSAKEISPEQFRASSALLGDIQEGEISRIRLEPWVYEYSERFPHDIRLLDENGMQWPFFLFVPQAQDASFVSVELRNLSKSEKLGGFVEFDVIVPGNNNSVSVHDGIEIVTTGSDYLRRVEIFGGEDLSMRLGTGYLVMESRNSKVRNFRISYPSNDQNRLRIRVFGNARKALDSFEIENARIRLRSSAEVEVEREQIPFEMMTSNSAKPEDNAQVLELDLQQSQLAVEWIRFEVEDKAFVRSVTMYGRNREEDNWRWIHTDAIYRKPQASKLEIALPGSHTAYRYLKIEERHFDDAALGIQKIELMARARFIVFEALSDQPAMVYVGDAELRAPQYDLIKRVDKAAISSLPLVEMSSDVTLGKTMGASKALFDRYGAWMSLVVIGIVAFFLVRVVLGMMRKLEQESE